MPKRSGCIQLFLDVPGLRSWLHVCCPFVSIGASQSHTVCRRGAHQQGGVEAHRSTELSQGARLCLGLGSRLGKGDTCRLNHFEGTGVEALFREEFASSTRICSWHWDSLTTIIILTIVIITIITIIIVIKCHQSCSKARVSQ